MVDDRVASHLFVPRKGGTTTCRRLSSAALMWFDYILGIVRMGESWICSFCLKSRPMEGQEVPCFPYGGCKSFHGGFNTWVVPPNSRHSLNRGQAGKVPVLWNKALTRGGSQQGKKPSSGAEEALWELEDGICLEQNYNSDHRSNHTKCTSQVSMVDENIGVFKSL